MNSVKSLLICLLFALSTKATGQCPVITTYNQGNGQSNTCPGQSGYPISNDFIGTAYSVIPTSSKTGNFTAKWTGIAIDPIPAIAGFYQGTTQLSDTAGPASAATTTGASDSIVKYCFYGPTNLPNSGNFSVVFVNPMTSEVMFTCSYSLGGGTLSPLAGPNITTQPASTVGCIGYRSSFSVAATPGTGSNTLTYQWKLNNVNITGATNNTYVINSVAASDTGNYYVVVTESNGTLITSNNVTLTLNREVVYTGGSSSWSTAGNWNTGVVPDSTKHVYIPASISTMPNVTSGTVKCKCLTIESGASLTIDGAALEIAGRINNSGTFTATNGTIVMNGTSVAQTIPASVFATNTIESLTIANTAGVSLGGTLNITGTYTPSSGVFSSGGYLVLKSNSSRTARVAAGSSGGSYITGDVTVERYLPANIHRAWRLLAPVTTGSQTIKAAWQEGATSVSSNPNPGYGTIIGCSSAYSTAAGFDTIIPSMSILAFSIASQSWTANPVTNTNTKLLSSEPGYFLYVRGDRSKLPSDTTNDVSATTLRSKGALRIGDQSAISVPATNYALVSNPYACAIDFSAIASGDRSNIDNFYYVWDPKLTGTYGLGGYVLFAAATSWSPSVSGGSYSTPTSVIPSGMAFFVRAGATTGSLTLRESHKVSDSSNTGFKTSADTTQQVLHVQLSAVDAANSLLPADGFFAIFANGYAESVDGDDIDKPVNFGENIGILRDGKTLALEARPLVTVKDTLPLRMWKIKKNSNYRLSFAASNFGADSQSAILIDNYLSKKQAISLVERSEYAFSVGADTASFSQNRFSIVIMPSAASLNPDGSEFEVYPNPVSGTSFSVRIKNNKDADLSLCLFDGQGRRVSYSPIHIDSNNSLFALDRSNLSAGSYFLIIEKGGKIILRKKMVFN